MLRLLKRIVPIECGQALPLAIIMLALGSTALIPVLNYTMDSLMNSTKMQNSVTQVYAAESGLMDSIWEMKFNNLMVTPGETFSLPEFVINGQTVNATIEKVNGPIHVITARTVNENQVDTMIQAFVYSPDPFIPMNFDHIDGNFELGANENYFGNINVNGNVSLGFGAALYGHINATGNIYMETDAYVIGDIHSEGEILLAADSHVEGSVISDNNIELESDASVLGDVCTGSNLILNSDASVHGNVYVANNATLYSDSTIHSNAYIGGTLKLYDGAEIFGDYPLGYDGCHAILGNKELTRILSWDITRCE